MNPAHMSGEQGALGFDVRGYCERLAKACPDRFALVMHEGLWLINDTSNPDAWFRLDSEPRPLAMDLWAFFGPIADERHICRVQTLVDVPVYQGYDYERKRLFGSLLESTIAAVVESFESEASGQ